MLTIEDFGMFLQEQGQIMFPNEPVIYLTTSISVAESLSIIGILSEIYNYPKFHPIEEVDDGHIKTTLKFGYLDYKNFRIDLVINIFKRYNSMVIDLALPYNPSPCERIAPTLGPTAEFTIPVKFNHLFS